MSKNKKHDASEARAVNYLRQRLSDQGYLVVEQVGNIRGNRRADALAIQTWASRGIHIDGYEFKRSRADVAKELSDPSKADAFAKYCRTWSLYAPLGLVDPDELPPAWGLLEIHTTGKGLRLKKTKKPEVLTPETIPPELWIRILSRVKNVAGDRNAVALGRAHDEGYRRGQRDRSIGTSSAETEKLRADYQALVSKVHQFELRTSIDIENVFEKDDLRHALMRSYAATFDSGWYFDQIDARLKRQKKALDELKSTIGPSQ